MDGFYLSHLSAAETKNTFPEDGKLLKKGKKKPDSGAFFCRLCQYDGLCSWQRHMIFAHLLNPLSCGQHCAAQYCTHGHAVRKALYVCNVTVSLQLADLRMHKSFFHGLG